MDWGVIIGNLIHDTIVFSTALIFAALGGMYSERSGVVNIALEGMMVIGAFTGAVFTFFAQDSFGSLAPWIGLVGACIAGALFATPHAVASITFKADQVVSGVALNFLATGLSVYLTKIIFNGAGQTTTLQQVFSKWHIPVLSDIPILGHAIFEGYPTSYIAFALVALSWYLLFKTSFGLRLRAVGEHPRAADTVGINVKRMRYTAVMISGALAAMGGATIALTTTSNFSHNTVSGQGFIALAALIFGKWHPAGAMGAALFFGVAQAIKSLVQIFGLTKYVPTEVIFMLPYILTILVLAGVVGRSSAPAALGKVYDTGSR
ncbi:MULTISPECIES: ABC transporter permease [Brevibacillus]|jgi:simple sugar transport system permease protein|uniref:ABC transporter permease n=1 Tax=Brevibacillus borstelensis AK1 TaxID=1300222 RepID=M8E4C9_9BACL|nr:ABC transporter permease [Brevibacillus borstelensis]EMT54116.1 ABC transporter permease [Brevibacillus borstelensis AK1]KKX53943.1 sugar ABC transporter permease [Brevibacillus borstelensis cifa_chp40]MBE5397966.1 ABC transporter permease [Brevibacillus borstelensis]MCC0563520.1 ABC transporter permease [Brevibacillus borstelensis]MCM3469671.1 ABC transporter permease [Brevibacillus borstelensis]